jgi:hypothetical protein
MNNTERWPEFSADGRYVAGWTPLKKGIRTWVFHTLSGRQILTSYIKAKYLIGAGFKRGKVTYTSENGQDYVYRLPWP